MSIKNNFSQIKKQLFSSNNNAIIHNKYILYIILFIALVDLHYLTVSGDFVSISIFILIAFLTTFFSKNMLVILFIAVTVTNILKYGSKIRQEGFEEGAKGKEGIDDDEKEALTEDDYKNMKYTNDDSDNEDEKKEDEDEKKEDEKKEDEKKEKQKKNKRGVIKPSEIAKKLRDIITILNS